MVFIISYVISGMIVSAYQLGNLTILIANGSRTCEMRNDIADLISYMKRNGLSTEICTCVKEQLQLQYARSYNEAALFKDILVSIRSQIFRMLYMNEITKIFLFNGCSPEFINQIASRLHEELFLPGEVIMDSEDVTDNLYFVCYGVLVKESRCPERIEALIKHCKEKRATELIFRMNTAAYDGDFSELEALIKAGAVPHKTDYNGRSVLHIASARGDAIFVKKLIDASIGDINGEDKYGHTPPLEAAKNGHTEAAGVLMINGAMLSMDVAGSVLCAAVASDKYEIVELMLCCGCEPNFQSYDGQTPLHLAASRDLVKISKLLVYHGADSHIRDRWRNTPLSVAEQLGHHEWIRTIKICNKDSTWGSYR